MEFISRRTETGEEHDVNLTKDDILRLIEDNMAYIFSAYPEKLRGSDTEIACKLIQKGYGDLVIENWTIIEGLDHERVIDELIENYYGPEVAENLQVLESSNHILNYREIAAKIFEKTQGWAVAKYIENFRGTVTREEVRELLIAAGLEKVADEFIEG